MFGPTKEPLLYRFANISAKTLKTRFTTTCQKKNNSDLGNLIKPPKISLNKDPEGQRLPDKPNRKPKNRKKSTARFRVLFRKARSGGASLGVFASTRRIRSFGPRSVGLLGVLRVKICVLKRKTHGAGGWWSYGFLVAMVLELLYSGLRAIPFLVGFIVGRPYLFVGS